VIDVFIDVLDRAALGFRDARVVARRRTGCHRRQCTSFTLMVMRASQKMERMVADAPTGRSR